MKNPRVSYEEVTQTIKELRRLKRQEKKKAGGILPDRYTDLFSRAEAQAKTARTAMDSWTTAVSTCLEGTGVELETLTVEQYRVLLSTLPIFSREAAYFLFVPRVWFKDVDGPGCVINKCSEDLKRILLEVTNIVDDVKVDPALVEFEDALRQKWADELSKAKSLYENKVSSSVNSSVNF